MAKKVDGATTAGANSAAGGASGGAGGPASPAPSVAWGGDGDWPATFGGAVPLHVKAAAAAWAGALQAAVTDKATAAAERPARSGSGLVDDASGRAPLSDAASFELWKLVDRMDTNLAAGLDAGTAARRLRAGGRNELTPVGKAKKRKGPKRDPRVEGVVDPVVLVVRDGMAVAIPAVNVVEGDVVILAPGAAVPADARIIATAAARAEGGGFDVGGPFAVSEAMLTGEAEPVAKRAVDEPALTDAGSLEVTDFVRQDHLVLGFTEAASGYAAVLVTATGANTMMGQIAGLAEGVFEEAHPVYSSALLSRSEPAIVDAGLYAKSLTVIGALAEVGTVVMACTEFTHADTVAAAKRLAESTTPPVRVVLALCPLHGEQTPDAGATVSMLSAATRSSLIVVSDAGAVKTAANTFSTGVNVVFVETMDEHAAFSTLMALLESVRDDADAAAAGDADRPSAVAFVGGQAAWHAPLLKRANLGVAHVSWYPACLGAADAVAAGKGDTPATMLNVVAAAVAAGADVWAHRHDKKKRCVVS
mmetsp:Transcript_4324/g.15916  ORF Transcript_4324/g.15916 Transcript_4324/m.15916 type:complete len:534 (-) Transcript_4324:170-1771(-)